MARFRYLLLSALLLATTSYGEQRTKDTKDTTEAIPDCAEPGASPSCESKVPATNVTTNGTTEAVPECAILCGDMLKTNETVNGTEVETVNGTAVETVNGTAVNGTEVLPKCASQGKFLLCHICPEKYYKCSYVNGSNSTFHVERFTCPLGTIFNVSNQDCANSSLVTTSLPEADIVIQQMEDVVNSSKDVCHIIKSIDGYDTTTITTLPLRRGLEYQWKFNDYPEEYNRDLEVAQSHMRLWRKGDSIVKDIRRMFYEAKGYEKEFDRMYEVSKGRMKDAEEESYRRVESLGQDIEGLKSNIAAKEAEAAEETDQLRMLKEIDIAHDRRQLIVKEKMLKASTPMGLKLEEMSDFIGFIRTHASEVMEMATNSSQRIEQLYKNIEINNNTFSDYADRAKEDLSDLKEEEQTLDGDIQKTRDEISNLKIKKDQLSEKEDALTTDNEEIFRRINYLRDEINNQKTIFGKKKKDSCREKSHFWDLFSNCDDILNYRRIEYKGLTFEEELKEKQQKQKQNLEEIEKILPQYAVINNEIKVLKANIPSKERRIDDIKYETQAFEMFIPDLENMSNGIPSVLKDLKELEKKIRTVETVFQLFNEDFGNMINHIETAKTESDQEETMGKIIEDLDLHEIRIDKSSKDITNVRLCTRLS